MLHLENAYEYYVQERFEEKFEDYFVNARFLLRRGALGLHGPPTATGPPHWVALKFGQIWTPTWNLDKMSKFPFRVGSLFHLQPCADLEIRRCALVESHWRPMDLLEPSSLRYSLILFALLHGTTRYCICCFWAFSVYLESWQTTSWNSPSSLCFLPSKRLSVWNLSIALVVCFAVWQSRDSTQRSTGRLCWLRLYKLSPLHQRWKSLHQRLHQWHHWLSHQWWNPNETKIESKWIQNAAAPPK